MFIGVGNSIIRLKGAAAAVVSYPATYRTGGAAIVSGSTQTLTATFSPAPASGTLLIAAHIQNIGDTVSAPTNGTGSAWTEISTGTVSRAWYKVCNGTEPTSYSVTLNGSYKGDAAALGIIEIKGQNATPLDTNVGTATSTNISPSITTQFDAELAISIFTTTANGAMASIPSGWTSVYQVNAVGMAGGAEVGFAKLQKATAGATGTATWTGATGTKVFTVGVRS